MDAKNLRVSDAEREHVTRLLERAVGRGYLTLAEFSDRTDAVLRSQTRGELNEVLVDIPGISSAEESANPVPAQHTPVQHAPAQHTPDAETIRGTMSSIKRTGPWTAPSLLILHTRMSSVSLDFTNAVTDGGVVTIELDDYLSSTDIIVPEGATVDLTGIHTFAASVDSSLHGGTQGGLCVVVRGQMRFGSVTAKYSLATKLRLMTRWRP